MARTTKRKTEMSRAAIYARVSDKSQDGEDKTSISEQIGEMEAYCESKGLTINARYQEVGRGWTKKRPEFQRMLADARRGRFDTIVCWKSDRLSRGMYPAAVLYLLQHLLKCGECGHNFHARCTRSTTNARNGKKYRYDLPTPNRYYMCNGMQSMRLRCRERPYIRAERLEEPIWSEVKRVIQNPDLIVAGMDTLDSPEGGGLEEEVAQAERDLRSIQLEEDRAIRLFVSGKIAEAQLDHQRKFITERLESARAKLDDYRAREVSGVEKRRLMESVLAWAREVGQGLDELTPEQRKEILQMIVEQVVIDRDNNVDITLAIPIDGDSPEPESVAIASKEPSS